MKIALGTVQFGLNYGVSNSNGQVPLSEIEKILNYAKENNIDTLDTAHLYGESEAVLGQFNLEDFNVVTKTIYVDPALDRQQNFEKFRDSFYESKKKLGYVELHGLMFHNANDLLTPGGLALWDLLEDFKQKDYVRKIGVSVYTPEQLEEILSIADIDIVQLPLNIFDQRFLPLLPRLKQKNIEIHTRSTFLQGLLFMQTQSLNPYFEPIKHILAQLPENRLEAALGFVNSIEEIDKIVVGVTSLKELEEIVNAINCPQNKDFIKGDFKRFIIEDERFILPQNWRLS